MIDLLVLAWVRAMLWLRYRVRVRGLREVARRGRGGILFLPSHPALIDPIILLSRLFGPFGPKALADRDQIDRFVIRRLARRFGVLAIPDVAKVGAQGRGQIERAIDEMAHLLRGGANVLLYPAGHVLRSRYEDLAGNSAVESLLERVRDCRVVLVRTRGLWGSGFSYASGAAPNLRAVLRRGLWGLLASGVFFAPRREVSIELTEATDLPRAQGRAAINRYIEDFLNTDPPRNTYVPYSLWEPGRSRELPEPAGCESRSRLDSVPAATRRIVLDYLRELSGSREIADENRLAHDLGLDSLAVADLAAWLGEEFGSVVGVEALVTVSDVLLAACGEAVGGPVPAMKPVDSVWFAHTHLSGRLELHEHPTIAHAFLSQARRQAGRAIVADQISGVKTYRDLVAGVLALRPILAALPGPYLGILLPASVAADVVYLAAMFAGKTPVMVNWTVGGRHLPQSLERLGVRAVVTAERLTRRIAAGGVDLSGIADRLVFLERLAGAISKADKLRAYAKARLGLWGELERAAIAPTAAVLFTSGSEATPKAVPLTHRNILADIRDALGVFTLVESDRLMSFLPPFHSFGLTVGMVLPLCAGLPAVYHANPTEGAVIGQLIHAYRATLVCGTPAFLHAIVRDCPAESLVSLRLAVTGAEKCSDRVYDALAARVPHMTVVEGYGVTECSPIVAVNRPENPRRGAIGPVLPGFEYAIVDEDAQARVAEGLQGMLLVRGPSVFEGYLGGEGPSPFVEFEGKRWYRTGDLVSQDASGVLTFRGRRKRFVKIGGEMISLPAIEAVLEPVYTCEGDQGPVLAVEATPDPERPELVLFIMRAAQREAVNQQIRQAGLSPLHNIRRVVQLEALPLLGTGKTDYRRLRSMLAGGEM